jgi:solute carrier family 25 protein 34/35
MSTATGAFIAGGLAACGAVTATHPFETVKIRLQLQGELKAQAVAVNQYRGILHGIRVIASKEGIRKLYKGLGCAYIYQTFLNGCRLGLYEPLRRPATRTFYGGENIQSLPINMVAGTLSGCMGAIAGSPFNLVKTRLQSYSASMPAGTQHSYKNALDGLRTIYRNEGIKGLYRGTGASVLRTGTGSSVQLPTYYWAKRTLTRRAGVQEGPSLHLMSSAVSGGVVCVCMHPAGKQSSLSTPSQDRQISRYGDVPYVQSKRQSVCESA